MKSNSLGNGELQQAAEFGTHIILTMAGTLVSIDRIKPTKTWL